MAWFSKKKPVGQWRRQPDEIAARFEAVDLERQFLNRQFLIYDGTIALAFRKGKLIGRLDSGKHDIDGPLRRWLVGDDPTAIIMTDAGDLTLDVKLSGLRSKEGIGFDADLRLTLALDAPDVFYLNVMKERKQYMLHDLRDHLTPELQDALSALAADNVIDQLHGNVTLREKAEDALRDRIGGSLERLGFRIVTLNVVAIASRAMEIVRGKAGDADIERRKSEVEVARLDVLNAVRDKVRESEKREKLSSFDLKEAINQAQHELGLRDRMRADELERLNERLNQDVLDFDLQRRRAREVSDLEHNLDLEETKHEHEVRLSAADTIRRLDERIAAAEAEQRVADLDRAGDEKDWEQAVRLRDSALKARHQQKMDECAEEAARIDAVSGTDTSTKIAIGLGDKDALLELERISRGKEMSPEQLLALAARDSEAAAAALAEMFKSKGRVDDQTVQLLRDQIEKERSTNTEHADRLERVLREGLQQMGSVATAKATPEQPPVPRTASEDPHGPDASANVKEKKD